MIIKLSGAVLIIVSCLAASRIIISHEEKRLRQLEAFIALIKYIRNRIDCYSVPVDKILAECPEGVMNDLGGKGEKMSFREITEREEILLEGESRQILKEFSDSLGKHYRERQVKLCDGAVANLETARDAEKKALDSKKKTVNALCLAIGGMAVILLL